LRRIFSIAVLFLSVLVLGSCGKKENSIIPSDALVSPNGKYALLSNVQEDIEDSEGKFYSIYEVELIEKENNTLICTFPIVGRDFSFLWDSNSRYAVAIYSGRTWTNYSVLDVLSHTQADGVNMLQIIEELSKNGEYFSYMCDSNRPAPQIYPLEWSPDNEKLLIAYQWTDTEGYRQSGVFVYDVFKGIFSNLIQYSPLSEYDNFDVKKPDKFIW
jgi:hypothetical protein